LSKENGLCFEEAVIFLPLHNKPAKMVQIACNTNIHNRGRWSYED